MSALPSSRFEALPSDPLEVEAGAELGVAGAEPGIEGIELDDDGIDGIDGIEDEEGDGGLGVDGALLVVAQPASMAAMHMVTGNSNAGRMIRFLQLRSRPGNCAIAWQYGCMPCLARVR